MSVQKRLYRPISVVLVALLAAAMAVVVTGTASAAAVLLFDQPFKNNTANGTGAVVLPTPSGTATNVACLTATGSTGSTGQLYTCPTGNGNVSTDTAGNGTLQLTPLWASMTGGVFAATSVPTAQGLDVSFNLYQWGGNGADGIAFALAAVDPANPKAPPNIGPTGGNLGYSGTSAVNGLANAYLGFGFDVFGNFSNYAFQGTGCGTSSTFVNYTQNVQVKGQLLIRGPGNLKAGYCAVNGTGTNASTTTPPQVALKSDTRVNSSVPVRILINSSKSPILAAGNVTVPAESYYVVFTPVSQPQKTLSGSLPVMSSSFVTSPSWLDSDGLPKQLAFGWVASTGGSNDHHEIANVKVSSLASVSQLTASQVSYTTGTTAAVGDPISYVVSPGVASGGLSDAGPISVTETVPTGVKPLAASGTGWVCAAPSGQTITCTNSNGPFAAGSTLNPVTITAVATASVPATTIQTASTVTASSDTGLAAFSTSSPAGTNPTAPSGLSLSPTSGSNAGGNSVTISGTNITGATSIQIGTSAELTAGTGTTLLKCATVAAPGCFTVSGSTLVISSMPAHAAVAVVVKVVNLGTSATTAYTYTSVPGTPVVTATAGVTSAAITWVAPATGGAAITGYTVTPYLGGVAQTALVQNPPAAATSASFTGLTAGGSYTFDVVAKNTNGLGSPGTSNAVVPYTVPGAPLTPAAAAGSTQATVTWTAPTSDGSSPITGYTVTPYIGATAQTAQVFNSTALTQTVTGLTPGTAYTFKIKATNLAGSGPDSSATGQVTVNALPTLSLTTPVAGEVGAVYTNPAFSATGGTGPFTWAVSAGSLPAGITLSPAGVLSGTPTASGAANFTVRVTDGSGKTATQALTLAVAAAPGLANPAPPNGQVGVAYSNQLAVTGGTGPFAWSISAGSLPAGVTINALTGLLSGTPTTAGPASFTVLVADAKGQTATQALGFTVTASPSLSFPAPPSGEVAVPYTNTLVVTGGSGSFTWSVSSGTLPAGLTLNASTGALSGTPSTAGSSTFTVRVQDGTGQFATQAVTLAIAELPTLTFMPAAGEIGAAYTAQPAVTGGTGAFTYAISSGTLPAGLSINGTTGVITGTPTAAGSSTVTIRVTDKFSKTAIATGTIVVASGPSLSLPPTPGGDFGVPYANQLAVTGGTGPFTWSISTGSLPDGLSLNASTGLISGTPTAGGDFTYTVRVTDGFSQSATQQLTTTIRGASTVSLASSAASVTPGGSVTLTATVGPGTPSGSVAFTETITSGPNTGQQQILGTGTIGSDGTASITTPLSAFGAHSVVATYGGDPSHVVSASSPSVVEVVGTSGSVLVTEFRLSGPGGGGDQFVELTNVSPSPVALTGFQVVTDSGVTTTLPSGSPVLPAGRSYLVAGPDFSLGSVAHADYSPAASLGSGGVKVLAPDTAHTQTDAVGTAAGFHLGTGLQGFTGTPTEQYAWVRTQQTSALKNTENNLADFALVATNAGYIGGVQSMLGSPSPTGLTDPWQHTYVVKSALLDPSVAASAAPNRVIVRTAGSPTLIQTRRVITNNSAQTVTAVRLRLHSLSEANGLPYVGGGVATGPVAHLRAVNPASATTTVTVNGSPVTVQNLSVAEPASGSPGGGLNSTFTVALSEGGLPPGGSVTVGFTLAADTGGTWWFGYDTDTLGIG